MRIKRPHIITNFIIAIALCNFLIFLFTPLSGDDFAYKSTFFGPCLYSDSLLDYPRWVARHWVYNNGRLFNLILPLLLGINKILISALGAIFIYIFYNQAIKACKLCRAPLYSALLVAVLTFVLPWWDSMTVFACQVNYIWVGAAIIWAYNRLTLSEKPCGPLTLIAVFVAAAGHEAASLPLLIGFIAYYLMRRKLPPKSLRPAVIALILGTAFVALCPGIILRAGTSVAPDDPLLPLALKTIPAVPAMLAIVVAMTLFAKTRVVVRLLLSSDALVLFVAAIASAVIALASGIVGRSGWFAEIFAILFIFRVLNYYKVDNRAFAYIIYALVLIQTIQVVHWQYKLGHEAENFEALYEHNDINVIHFDATADSDVPWWLFGRFKGVPDADDVYLLLTLAEYYHPGAPMPVILPTEAQNIDVDNDTIYLSNGSFITQNPPHELIEHSTEREKIVMHIYMRDNVQWVVQAFERDGHTLYYHSRRILDPGDR